MTYFTKFLLYSKNYKVHRKLIKKKKKWKLLFKKTKKTTSSVYYQWKFYYFINIYGTKNVYLYYFNNCLQIIIR